MKSRPMPLIDAGIAKDNMETSSYNQDPVKDNEKGENITRLFGFRTCWNVTIKDINKMESYW